MTVIILWKLVKIPFPPSFHSGNSPKSQSTKWKVAEVCSGRWRGRLQLWNAYLHCSWPSYIINECSACLLFSCSANTPVSLLSKFHTLAQGLTLLRQYCMDLLKGSLFATSVVMSFPLSRLVVLNCFIILHHWWITSGIWLAVLRSG